MNKISFASSAARPVSFTGRKGGNDQASSRLGTPDLTTSSSSISGDSRPLTPQELHAWYQNDIRHHSKSFSSFPFSPSQADEPDAEDLQDVTQNIARNTGTETRRGSLGRLWDILTKRR